MHRRRAASLIGLVAAGLAVTTALVWPRPEPPQATVADASVHAPIAEQWARMLACSRNLPDDIGVSAMRVEADGRLDIEFGSYLEVDGSLVDPVSVPGGYRPATAVGERVDACMRELTIARVRELREPTAAERGTLYDWAARVQVPCLAARGVDVALPSRAAFMRQGSAHWFLLPQHPHVPVEQMLETRRACPPVPAFLVAEGLDW